MTPIEPTGPPGIAMLPTCFRPCAAAVPADAIAAAAKRVAATVRVFDRAGIRILPNLCDRLTCCWRPSPPRPSCVAERMVAPSFFFGDLARIRFLDLARHEGRQI